MAAGAGRPAIADSLLSSGGFRNAVCLFISKQQITSLAKEEVEEAFHKLSSPQKDSIRAALPRHESTFVKLIKAALVRLSEYNQQYFTSEEQFSMANRNKEYHNIPLSVLMTLQPTHPITKRIRTELRTTTTIRTELRIPYMDARGSLIFT